MMNLLKQACQDHYKTVKKELIDSLEKLKSTCTETTFNHINNFLKVTKDELCNTLQTRRNTKRISNGRCSSLQALRSQNNDLTNSNATATNNTPPAHDISVTPTPHVNHNTSTRHRRRCFVKKPVSRHKPYKFNEMFIRSEKRYTYITNCTKGFIITEITGLYSLLWRVVRLNNNPG